jgi:hypothetical protein
MGTMIIANVIFGVTYDITVSPPKDCALFFSRLSSMFLVSRSNSSNFINLHECFAFFHHDTMLVLMLSKQHKDPPLYTPAWNEGD